MTAEQAALAIAARLRQTDILKDPHVSITVSESATQGVTVLGEVKNPGVYPLLGSHGLLDLISASGGATPNAGKAVTVTHREDPNHPEIVKVESKPGSSGAVNVDIRPGDPLWSRTRVSSMLWETSANRVEFLIENNDRLTGCCKLLP